MTALRVELFSDDEADNRHFRVPALRINSGSASSHAVLAATGAQLWSYATGDDVVCSPTGVGGTVYADTSNGTLYAFTVPAPSPDAGQQDLPDN